MKANTTVISREIDTGWIEGWGGNGIKDDGGTGCIETDHGFIEGWDD